MEYLIEMFSLSVLRNRITDLETRYGVGHLEPDELQKKLNLEKSIRKNLTGIFHEYLNERKKMDLDNTEYIEKKRTLLNQIKGTMDDGVQEMLTGSKGDPQMSEAVPVKAAKHYMRCMAMFYLFPFDAQIMEMRKIVKDMFRDEVENACREVGYIVVKTSTVGVHLLPPGFPIRVVTPTIIKKGLIRFNMADNGTLNAIDMLYCNQVQEDQL